YRELNKVDTVQCLAQSQDLNLIEALWMDMETELGNTWGRIGDNPTLEACLTAVWKALPEKWLEDLIRSIPQRLQAVIDAEGGATAYWIMYIENCAGLLNITQQNQEILFAFPNTI
ncbi:hypothetical protein BDD12DRAFT_750659, partial [Trichophaea hybrida]